MSSALTKETILHLFDALNDELRSAGVSAHVKIAGGAVMCLAFDARKSTKDVDATFEPSVQVLDAAIRVAEKEGVRDTWLNDAVKGYLSDRGPYEPYLKLSNLEVSRATAEYMLAMKCLAIRTGAGFQDEEDIRYLLRNLGITRYGDAEQILRDYYPIGEYPGIALSALREILGESGRPPRSREAE